MKNTIKQLIIDFHNDAIPKPSLRILTMPRFSGKLRKAYTFVGMRRSGKTWTLYQIMQSLLQQGINVKQILYINFADDRLANCTCEDLQFILDAYFELYPDNINSSHIHFFFDEIHEILGWEKFIRRLLDTEKMELYLTGSSAKMLSKEIATQLRGRAIEMEIFPLSFYECLRYQEITPQLPITSKQKPLLNHHLQHFLRYGGFPETLSLFDDISYSLKIRDFEISKNDLIKLDYFNKYFHSINMQQDCDRFEKTDGFLKLNKKIFADFNKFEKTNSFLNILNKENFASGQHRDFCELLQGYINTVIGRDIIERHKIRNSYVIKELLMYIIKNSATLFSVHKQYKNFKSRGSNVSKDSLYNFMKYFEDAYCIFNVPIYNFSLREQSNKEKKIYPVDQGLITAYTIKDTFENASRLETSIFLHLRRQHKQIYYYQTKKGTQIDLLTLSSTGEISLYQVTITLNDQSTKHREVNALNHAMKELNIKTGMIVTLDDEEQEIKTEFGNIYCVPANKFLLTPSN